MSRPTALSTCASLGDIVGYGPSPVESLHLAHDSFTVSVLGNHDAAVCGLRGISDGVISGKWHVREAIVSPPR